MQQGHYTEPFDRAKRLDLVKKAGIVESVARSSLIRILETKLLWQHFQTKASLMAFWNLPLANRERLWGTTIDPMAGIAGFDERQFSDADLGSHTTPKPPIFPVGV